MLDRCSAAASCGAAIMNTHGASPGEGPRRGWHGSENWGASSWKDRLEEFAEGAEEGRTKEEWMSNRRPVWFGGDLGEEHAQQKQHKWPDYQYTGPEQSDKYKNADWSSCLDEWHPARDNSDSHVGQPATQPARSSMDEWTAVDGSSTAIVPFKSNMISGDRWESVEVEAAKQVKLSFGVGMVEQPMSRSSAAFAFGAAVAPGLSSPARPSSPSSCGRPRAPSPPSASCAACPASPSARVRLTAQTLHSHRAFTAQSLQ